MGDDEKEGDGKTVSYENSFKTLLMYNGFKWINVRNGCILLLTIFLTNSSNV